MYFAAGTMDSEGVPAGPRYTTQMNYKVHPLVMLNISEHFTRFKVNKKDRSLSDQVFGVILGVVDGKAIEVQNSFEVPFMTTPASNDIPLVDDDFWKTRLEQYQKVFPELEPLGWYTTGDANEVPTDLEKAMYRQFGQWSDSPIFIRLDVTNAAKTQQLPLTVFDYPHTENFHPDPAEDLRSVEWTLVSEDSERIGVDHVTRMSHGSNAGHASEIAQQIRSTATAAEMLKGRMKVVHDYVKGVKEGRLPPNEEILKLSNKLVQQLPLMETDSFEKNFNAEQADVNAAMLVTDMVKLCGAMNHLQSKLHVLAMERPPEPRPGGKMFRRAKTPEFYNL